MPHLPFVFVLVLLFGVGLAPPSNAGLIIFTDKAAFLAGLSTDNIEVDLFSDLPNGYYANPIERSMGTPFGYTIAPSTGTGFVLDSGSLSTLLRFTDMELNMTPGAVRAFGADLSIQSPITGEGAAATLVIQEVGGAQYEVELGVGGGFVGVVATEGTLGKFVVGPAMSQWLMTVDNLTFSAVPAPAALSLLGISILLGSLSRRRPHGGADRHGVVRP